MKKNNNIRIRNWIGARTAQTTFTNIEHKLKRIHPESNNFNYAL